MSWCCGIMLLWCCGKASPRPRPLSCSAALRRLRGVSPQKWTSGKTSSTDNKPPVKKPALPDVMVLWYYAVVVLW